MMDRLRREYQQSGDEPAEPEKLDAKLPMHR
jgi:hypothetical protein